MIPNILETKLELKKEKTRHFPPQHSCCAAVAFAKRLDMPHCYNKTSTYRMLKVVVMKVIVQVSYSVLEELISHERECHVGDGLQPQSHEEFTSMHANAGRIPKIKFDFIKYKKVSYEPKHR